MRKLLLLAVLLSSAGFSQSQNFVEKFAGANKLYESEKYSEAINNYKELLNSGQRSAEVYYNLGNAYLKDKKVGYSILYYEKALKISPRDPDIKYNLDYVKSFVKETTVEDVASKFLNQLYNFATLNELVLLTSIILFILISLLFFYMFRKIELIYWLNVGFGILFLLLLIWTGARIYQNENIIYAIVIESLAESRSAPQNDYPVSFTIPEGKKVQILQTRNNWYEIFLKSENLKGWVKEEILEII
ncbi:MAG: tetratricopeptide repeat protein [Candidatus Firestonebacteria bacterium]